MADTSAGFRYRYRLSGGPPTIQSFIADTAAKYHKGDMLSIAADGDVEIAATNSKLIVGVCNETKVCDGTATKIEVIVDDDAVYGVYDANARAYYAPLDVAGATGAMTVAADSNHDLTVVAMSLATEETLVKIQHGAHPMTVTTT